MANNKYNYIIYHKNCLDGFTGFYLFMKSKKWKKNPIVHPDMPSAKKVPPNINNKNVIIIDVAYHPDILQQIIDKANKVLYIDHHETHINKIKKMKLKKLNIVYDKNKSGASLVWYTFFHNKTMPRFVKYVEDNDIGRWEDDNTLPFVASMEIYFKMGPNFKNLKKWDKLLDDKYVDSLIKKGKIIMQYKNHLIGKYSKKYSIKYFPSKMVANIDKKILNKIGQYKVAVINSRCPTLSLLGKKIVDTVDCDFVLLWIYIIDKKEYHVSLRSKEVNVSDIAKYMGGGGHKLASAFSFSSNDFRIDDLFTNN